MNPKISIVIPVYNVEKYLRECLDSVWAQTLTDWECICVDDGSTDSSPAILDEYAAKDSRFTIIKREHSNAGACRNVGLDIAKGEYLSFLDADDVFASRMLENMLRIAEEYGPDIVVCSKMDFSLAEQLNAFYLKAKERHSVEILHKPAETINIFERWMGWAWDKLFKRVQVIKYGFKFQECPANNDLSFVFSMLSVARSIVEVREVFVAHRKHLQSIEGSVGYKNPWCVCNALSHYYGQMFRLGVFEGNDFLLRNFLNYTICFSIGRLCVSKAYDEISSVLQSFRNLLATLKLEQYDASWFSDNMDFYTWCLKCVEVEEDYLAIRELFLTLLGSRNEAKNRLQRLQMSRSYRLVRFLSKIWNRLRLFS